MIALDGCQIEKTDFGSVTRFDDGSYVNSVAYTDAHYHVIAHRCGYNDDVLQYCFEHDFCHLFISLHLLNKPSPILWALAHGSQIPDHEAAFEEIAVHAFQRWLRANEQPIVAGVDWFGMKAMALDLLDNNYEIVFSLSHAAPVQLQQRQ